MVGQIRERLAGTIDAPLAEPKRGGGEADDDQVLVLGAQLGNQRAVLAFFLDAQAVGLVDDDEGELASTAR